MADWFDRHIDRLAFRLELVEDDGGGQHIVWHYRSDDGDTVYQSEPHAGFWKKIGVGLAGVLPLEWLL